MTPRDSVIAVLAPAVGAERADELVTERARVCLGTSNVLTDDDALALLRSFADDSGLVGASARLALRRKGITAPGAQGSTFTIEEIAALFEAAVGEEKARASVRDVAQRLGIGDSFGRADAMRILETLAASEGLLGVTARFAKARFLLRTS